MAKQSRRDIRALLLAPSADLAVQVDQRLRRLGFPMLRPAQTQLLTLVEEGGKRLTDLVEAMHLPKQTLGDMVDDLESQKLVERYPDPEHGVIKRVRLAARGRAWAAEVRKVAESTEARWAARLGKAKLKTLRGLLEELGSEIGAVGEAEPAVEARPNGKRVRA
ncbi:MAG TPA: MarR family transcriptional regulator [Kofleriaceae bacterium]|jgi:DNA-binding MarR family transcriptional regulator|nr:MarR family transcriptional regulator [Kofleriaceae bacterium]